MRSIIYREGGGRCARPSTRARCSFALNRATGTNSTRHRSLGRFIHTGTHCRGWLARASPHARAHSPPPAPLLSPAWCRLVACLLMWHFATSSSYQHTALRGVSQKLTCVGNDSRTIVYTYAVSVTSSMLQSTGLVESSSKVDIVQHRLIVLHMHHARPAPPLRQARGPARNQHSSPRAHAATWS